MAERWPGQMVKKGGVPLIPLRRAGQRLTSCAASRYSQTGPRSNKVASGLSSLSSSQSRQVGMAPHFFFRESLGTLPVGGTVSETTPMPTVA
jgi:hypothetical protein